MRRLFISIVLLTLVTGCATSIPESIRKPAPGDISLTNVRGTVELYRGQPVRWGGMIASVENLKTETVIEIVARSLSDNGRPQMEDQSAGRFLAKISGFLDPAEYKDGRELTVSGTVVGERTRQIGDYAYNYPVIKAESIHLWRERQTDTPVYPYHRYPYYYYDPFWASPWYPYPWWHHPYYW